MQTLVIRSKEAILLLCHNIPTQSTRAMFCLLKEAQSLLLPIDYQIEMFEKMVKQIIFMALKSLEREIIDIEQVQSNF